MNIVNIKCKNHICNKRCFLIEIIRHVYFNISEVEHRSKGYIVYTWSKKETREAHITMNKF